MPRRTTASTPVRDASNKVSTDSLPTRDEPPATHNERLSNRDHSHQQRFKQISAHGSARMVNGTIIYGNVVHHHPGGPAILTDAADMLQDWECSEPVRDAQEALEHQRRLREEQRKLLEEAMGSLVFKGMDVRYATTNTAQTDTCGWILNTPGFTKWSHRGSRDKRQGCLMIKSKLAAGKSTIMKFAIKHAEAEALQRAEGLALKRSSRQRVDKSDAMDINIHFFFNARGDSLERTAEGMYRSLLHQLVTQHKDEKLRYWLTARNKPTQTGWQWPLEVLQTTFEDGVLGIGDNHLACYIDALDECDSAQARDLVAFFQRLLERTAAQGVQFRVCFTSRHYPHISMDGALEINLESEDGHRKDIEQYIKARLKVDTSDAERIRADLQIRAAGVFLWVVLVIKILNQESDRGRSFALRQRLRELPDDLNDLFQNILDPHSHDRKDGVLMLQWIMFASRPLHCQELYFAVRTGLESSAVFPSHDGYPSHDTMARFILHTSRGLAELTSGSNPVVQFVHESIREFLFREEGLSATHTSDSIGRKHEQAWACCDTYISAACAEENSMVARELPFLRYAVAGVLYHANAAQSNGVPQDKFVASFCPNTWLSIARLTDPVQFSKASADILSIFAEAQANHLLHLAVQRDGRFVAHPGRYIRSTGTVVAQQKPTEVELLLLDDHADEEPEDESLQDLLNMSLTARYNLVMALLLQHRWTGHIEDELCLKFLTWALMHEHHEVVELLVSHIVQLEGYTYSMLELAAEDGATTVVKMLLSKNTSDSLHERRYGRLLRTAVYLGHYQIAKLLLDRGADVHFLSPRHGHLLWIAAKAGHSRIVQMLCDRGAMINRRAVKSTTSTPLQVACFHRHVETVRVLLECGADVTLEAAEYGTALEAALYWPHSDQAKMVVQMLRSHGAVI